MAPKSIYVIDPVNRTGKIVIPMDLTEETRGLSEYLKCANRAQRDLSLCLLFQKNKCNAGSRCHQIHASKEYVSCLREKATSTSTCCAAHGDVHSTALSCDARKVQMVAVDGSVSLYALSHFGATQALEVLLRNSSNGTIRVTANKICRLHGQSRCKFGRDCKNIHLCREIVNGSHQSSATSTPVKGSPVIRPVDVQEISPLSTPEPTIRTTKRSVTPPQPADFFRLDDIATAPTPSKEAAPGIFTPSSVAGFSPMSCSFQIYTPLSSTTSVSSKNSAIVRPLKPIEIQETHQATVSTLFDNFLQRPLTRSKIGVSPSIGSLQQSEVDMRRLCDDILGSLSPSWVMA